MDSLSLNNVMTLSRLRMSFINNLTKLIPSMTKGNKIYCLLLLPEHMVFFKKIFT